MVIHSLLRELMAASCVLGLAQQEVRYVNGLRLSQLQKLTSPN
jgi:hypothetical protein